VEDVWLWESELREQGFRRKSERYWQCKRRFGLGPDEYLSLFSLGEQTLPGGRGGSVRFVVELTEFHVTFRVGFEHVHYYYHERQENEWEPGGHTSAAKVRRLGLDSAALRARADAIAAEFIALLGGACRPRHVRRRERTGESPNEA
jgi:hypothetical protein